MQRLRVVARAAPRLLTAARVGPVSLARWHNGFPTESPLDNPYDWEEARERAREQARLRGQPLHPRWENQADMFLTDKQLKLVHQAAHQEINSRAMEMIQYEMAKFMGVKLADLKDWELEKMTEEWLSTSPGLKHKDQAGEVELISNIPDELRNRKALIRPGAYNFDQGQRRLDWVIDWSLVHERQWQSAIMGWSGGEDPMDAVGTRFASLSEAVRYAKSKGYWFEVDAEIYRRSHLGQVYDGEFEFEPPEEGPLGEPT